MASPPPAGAAQHVRLEQLSFPRLLFALLRQRFSGCLQVVQPPPAGDEAATRTVWLRGGMPVFTDWMSPGLVLGQVMLRERMLDEARLMQALQSMAGRGGLLGQTLVAQGAVEPSVVVEGLRRQCAAKIVEMFALHSGVVTISACVQEAPQELASVNVLELVRRGVAAHYDRARIMHEMRDAFRGHFAGTAALQRYRPHFRFRDDDSRPLDAIARGGVTLEQLESMATSPQQATRIVYTLWACQMLRVGTAAASPTPRAQPTPRPPSAPPVAQASDGDFETQLTALERKIESGTHPFDLLGIAPTAGKKEIRRAFGDLSVTFHPDGLQAKGLSHLRERVSRAFAALSEAQMLLGDKEKREELRQRIERGEDPTQPAGSDPTAMARAALESEVIAKEADKLLRAGRFDRALERYEQAAALAPEEPDLQAAIVWCRYNVSNKDLAAGAKADTELATIVQANPKLARAHYFRGLVLKDLGRTKPAIEALAKAIEHDPRLVDAERQARILRMRAGGPASSTPNKSTETAGRFGLKGLFGKK